MLDLIVLVADKDMEYALRGVLGRPASLAIRPIKFDFLSHANHDPGVRKTGAQSLALRRQTSTHALMVLDFEGSGSDLSAAHLRRELDAKLESTWGADARTVVIEPELEAWVWGAENAVKEVFEWGEPIGIRDWLRGRGFTFNEQGKPQRPKNALEELTYSLRRPRSSALFKELAEQLSLKRCEDAAFRHLCNVLTTWFGVR